MTRPLTSIVAVVLLAFVSLLSACGGGGGGGGGGTDGGNQPSGTIYLPSLRIVGTASGSASARSLDNLVVGDRVDVRALAIYLTTTVPTYGGAAYQSDVGNITLNADSSVATLDGSTLVARGTGSGTISLSSNGQTLIANVQVSSNLGTISGRVRTVSNQVDEPGIATVPVRFADSSGNIVATVYTGPDGRYVAHVPAGTAVFYADFAGFTNSYYNVFEYDSNTYTYDSATGRCGVTLTGVTAATNRTLDDSIATTKASSSGPPPPPVTGCRGTSS